MDFFVERALLVAAALFPSTLSPRHLLAEIPPGTEQSPSVDQHIEGWLSSISQILLRYEALCFPSLSGAFALEDW